MCLFYHKWVETTRYFAPPRPSTYKGTADDETLLKIIQGFTTIEMHCAQCNNIKSIVLIGKCINVS